jgi:hypothetical protein
VLVKLITLESNGEVSIHEGESSDTISSFLFGADSKEPGLAMAVYARPSDADPWEPCLLKTSDRISGFGGFEKLSGLKVTTKDGEITGVEKVQ